jgi:hypothetical protein
MSPGARGTELWWSISCFSPSGTALRIKRSRISSIPGLREEVPGTGDLSVGEDFSGRSGGYTHALFARFEDIAELQENLMHPAHQAVVDYEC